MLQRIRQARTGVLDWLDSVRNPEEGWGRWRYHARSDAPWALNASGLAIQVLGDLGALASVPDAQKTEAADYFRGCQDAGSGLFKDPLETEAQKLPRHSWEQVWGQRHGSVLEARRSPRVRAAAPDRTAAVRRPRRRRSRPVDAEDARLEQPLAGRRDVGAGAPSPPRRRARGPAPGRRVPAPRRFRRLRGGGARPRDRLPEPADARAAAARGDGGLLQGDAGLRRRRSPGARRRSGDRRDARPAERRRDLRPGAQHVLQLGRAVHPPRARPAGAPPGPPRRDRRGRESLRRRAALALPEARRGLRLLRRRLPRLAPLDPGVVRTPPDRRHARHAHVRALSRLRGAWNAEPADDGCPAHDPSA